MADIRAFRGFRYDLGRVGTLSDVVAPPYDVIDPALATGPVRPQSLQRHSPDPQQGTRQPTPSRQPLHARRASPARLAARGESLVQDSARSLYVYHQDFEVEGKRFTRKGFLARVRLEPFGKGRIYPHEETLAGPKADRLKLFHATGHESQSGLRPVSRRGRGRTAALDKAVGRAPPLEATDHLGVVSRLWPVTDQHVVSAVTGLLGPKPVFIADGHHRYETALRTWRRRSRPARSATPSRRPTSSS